MRREGGGGLSMGGLSIGGGRASLVQVDGTRHGPYFNAFAAIFPTIKFNGFMSF
jgi:hypothetical protein